MNFKMAHIFFWIMHQIWLRYLQNYTFFVSDYSLYKYHRVPIGYYILEMTAKNKYSWYYCRLSHIYKTKSVQFFVFICFLWYLLLIDIRRKDIFITFTIAEHHMSFMTDMNRLTCCHHRVTNLNEFLWGMISLVKKRNVLVSEILLSIEKLKWKILPLRIQ